MNKGTFTTTFRVHQPQETVFGAINNVRGWCSDIEGHADKIGDNFTHRVLDLHRCDIAVKDLVPGEKVAWTVVDNYFNFTKDKTEWKDTDIVFEIARIGDKSEVKLT